MKPTIQEWKIHKLTKLFENVTLPEQVPDNAGGGNTKSTSGPETRNGESNTCQNNGSYCV